MALKLSAEDQRIIDWQADPRIGVFRAELQTLKADIAKLQASLGVSTAQQHTAQFTFDRLSTDVLLGDATANDVEKARKALTEAAARIDKTANVVADKQAAIDRVSTALFEATEQAKGAAAIRLREIFREAMTDYLSRVVYVAAGESAFLDELQRLASTTGMSALSSHHNWPGVNTADILAGSQRRGREMRAVDVLRELRLSEAGAIA
jgi:hypothetical protein